MLLPGGGDEFLRAWQVAKGLSGKVLGLQYVPLKCLSEKEVFAQIQDDIVCAEAPWSVEGCSGSPSELEKILFNGNSHKGYLMPYGPNDWKVMAQGKEVPVIFDRFDHLHVAGGRGLVEPGPRLLNQAGSSSAKIRTRLDEIATTDDTERLVADTWHLFGELCPDDNKPVFSLSSDMDQLRKLAPYLAPLIHVQSRDKGDLQDWLDGKENATLERAKALLRLLADRNEVLVVIEVPPQWRGVAAFGLRNHTRVIEEMVSFHRCALAALS